MAYLQNLDNKRLIGLMKNPGFEPGLFSLCTDYSELGETNFAMCIWLVLL
jgi:hypothetical protein